MPTHKKAKAIRNLTNKHIEVFRLIQTMKAVDRVSIAARLDLPLPSVTYVVKQLIDFGFVQEGERLAVPRGQPRIKLEVNPDFFRQIGISIDANCLTIGLTNLAGKLLKTDRFPGEYLDPNQSILFLKEKISSLLKETEIGDERLLGVGCAIPGNAVNNGQYFITPDAMLQWSGFEISRELANQVDIPVFTENDAKAGAIGELLCGEGKDTDSFYYLSIGVGLGGAYVEDSRLIGGAHGNLGELGAILPAGLTRPTLSSLCETLDISLEHSNDDDIIDVITKRESVYNKWFSEAMENFNRSIGIVAKFLRPETIIITSKLPEVVTDRIIRCIEFEPFQPPRYRELPQARLVRSKLKSAEAELIGASFLPVHRSLY